MKKTITILSALAITGSPALALNVVNHKTQNLQNICKPNKIASAKSNGVANYIVTQQVTDSHLYFQVRLNNSTYNGFPGFMNQIKILNFNWSIFFFQWIDDNDFSYLWFPDLSVYTQHGFFHDPMTWSNRLEDNLGHFGSWVHNKSTTAYKMVNGVNAPKYFKTFGQDAEKAYNTEVATGKIAGIMFNFGFTFIRDNYTVLQPNYAFIYNS